MSGSDLGTSLVRRVLDPGGLLERRLALYEPRPSQVQMAEAVARAFGGEGRLLVEAPPGTGKTFAYLVPAVETGRTVVISTGTRTLQDQLFLRDIPVLAEALGRPIRAALMKGRENYLCLVRLDDLSAQRILDLGVGGEDAARLSQVREWSRATQSGDRAEVPGLPEPWPLWEKIDAGADTCLGQRCTRYEECFLTRMRRRALEADLIAVNHHLLLSDLVLKASAYGAVIPPYQLLVIDEAHMLEEIATAHLGRGLSSFQITSLIGDAAALSQRPDGLGSAEAAAVAGRCREVRSAAADFQSRFDPMEGRFLLAPLREDLSWVASGRALRGALESLAHALEASAIPTEIAEGLRQRSADLASTLKFLIEGESEETVIWGERRGRGFALNASPIDVSAILADLLFDRIEAAVLTSATLSVDGSFDFVAARLGIEGAEAMSLHSPFDLRSQSILYLPRVIPEPSDPGFPDAALDEIIALLSITEGRAFVLFTSFASMRRTREALEGRVPFPLLVQGEASRNVLLEWFRSTPHAVLLATSSFWQGVDVPGEALSLVVIEKLPFDVPSDPIVAARCESVRRRGGNPFTDYQVPAAVIDLKQGLGRLLRSRTDRGVLAVLDGRLRTRRYGETFLRSLPPYPVADTLEAVRAFFVGPPGDAEERRPADPGAKGAPVRPVPKGRRGRPRTGSKDHR